MVEILKLKGWSIASRVESIALSNKKLLVTSASLLVTSALLVVTRTLLGSFCFRGHCYNSKDGPRLRTRGCLMAAQRQLGKSSDLFAKLQNISAMIENVHISFASKYRRLFRLSRCSTSSASPKKTLADYYIGTRTLVGAPGLTTRNKDASRFQMATYFGFLS